MINNILFIGSKKLGLKALKEIRELAPEKIQHFITVDDSSDVRSDLDSFSKYAEESGLEMFTLKKPSGLKEIVGKIKPDLCIVVGWYWILPESVLDMVPRGVIGMHGSLLPAYRGFAPFVWAILNDEEKTGISMFYFDKGMDTGDIVDQAEIPIAENDTIADVLHKAEVEIIDLLRKNLPLLIKGTARRIKQSGDNISYCGRRKPEDGLINWTDNNINIHNFIRAQSSPYPGAFTYLNGKKITILKAKIFSYPYFGVPGAVSYFSEGRPVVACGDGAIEIIDAVTNDEENNIIDADIKFGTQFGGNN